MMSFMRCNGICAACAVSHVIFFANDDKTIRYGPYLVEKQRGEWCITS